MKIKSLVYDLDTIIPRLSNGSMESQCSRILRQCKIVMVAVLDLLSTYFINRLLIAYYLYKNFKIGREGKK